MGRSTSVWSYWHIRVSLQASCAGAVALLAQVGTRSSALGPVHKTPDLHHGHYPIAFAGHQLTPNIALARLLTVHKSKSSFLTSTYNLAACARPTNHITTPKLTCFKSAIVTILDAINTFEIATALSRLSNLPL